MAEQEAWVSCSGCRWRCREVEASSTQALVASLPFGEWPYHSEPSAWFSELDTQPGCNSGGQHVPTAVSGSNGMEPIPVAPLLPQGPCEQRSYEALENSWRSQN